jgi:hypothetical protein
MKGYTLVISVVAASISRSSAVRSAKPGRACFAWSFSKATTKTKEERERKHGNEDDVI